MQSLTLNETQSVLTVFAVHVHTLVMTRGAISHQNAVLGMKRKEKPK